MLSEVRVGTSRSAALKAMAERIDLPAMTAFLSALLQADKLGMSVGKVLRIQSETVRIERSQRAERRANEAPVKILIPLILFIFPTIWIILAGPLLFSWLF
jgi:tight adherence protein C